MTKPRVLQTKGKINMQKYIIAAGIAFSFAAATFIFIACGGSGDSKEAKGQKITLNPAQQKVLSANLAMGKQGASSVSRNYKTSGNSVSANSLPQTVYSIIADSANAWLSRSNSNVRANSDNSDNVFPLDYNESCPKSGNIKVTGSITSAGTSDSGSLSFSISMAAQKCIEATDVVDGTFSFGLDAKGNQNSADVKMTMAGKTNSSVEIDGKNEDHSVAFKDFSLSISIDQDFAKQLQGAESDADANEKLKALVDRIKCSGSFTIDTQDFSCADILQTAIEANGRE
jgi:hypothetical protein